LLKSSQDFHPTEPWILTTLYSGIESSEMGGSTAGWQRQAMSTSGPTYHNRSSRHLNSPMYPFALVASLRGRIG